MSFYYNYIILDKLVFLDFIRNRLDILLQKIDNMLLLYEIYKNNISLIFLDFLFFLKITTLLTILQI